MLAQGRAVGGPGDGRRSSCSGRRKPPAGGGGVTSRIVDEGGKIRAGLQSTDFALPERGEGRLEFAPGQNFRIQFSIDAKDRAEVVRTRVVTSDVHDGPGRVGESMGADVLFVRSGSLMHPEPARGAMTRPRPRVIEVAPVEVDLGHPGRWAAGESGGRIPCSLWNFPIGGTTMKATRFVGMAGLLTTLLVPCGIAARAAEPTPEQVLAGRGMEQDGKYFVLKAAESEVMAQLNVVLPLVDRLQNLANIWAENLQMRFYFTALDDERIVRLARIQEIDTLLPQIQGNTIEVRLTRQGLQRERGAIQSSMPAIRAEIALAQKSWPRPRREQTHARQVKEAYQAFIEAYGRLTPVAKSLCAAYSGLRADSQVSNAAPGLLRQSKGVNLQLGLSPGSRRR